MTDINIWQFLAGLGLFLFAMKLLEQALAQLGSNSFRDLLRRHTHSPLRAVSSGTLATTIVQSSSLVGLFTLALAGAGMLELRNAVGIILGANLGTTITGWLVATLGFKLSLSGLALPLIAAGSLGSTLLSDRRPGWQFLLALGLLLFGLDWMKSSLEALQTHLDIAAIHALHPLLMFLLGALLTAIIQSSSGTMVITLGALNAGMIELPQAGALIIGADLGTTSTLILGGLPGSQLQRQIAAAHFIFNVAIDFLALLSLPLLLWLVTEIYQLGDLPLLALVAIHSTFNLIGVALFLPLVPAFAERLQRLFPTGEDHPLQAIPVAAGDIAVEALENANRELLLTIVDLNRHCFKIEESRPVKHFDDAYETLKTTEADILLLAQRLQQEGLRQPLIQRTAHAVESTRESVIAAKEIKDIRENLVHLRHHPDAAIQDFQTKLKGYQKRLYRQLERILSQRSITMVSEHVLKLDADNRQQHEELHTYILPLVNDERLQPLCPTLLNINREVYLSNQALKIALEETAACGSAHSQPAPEKRL